MLDIKFIRENPKKVKQGTKNKNIDPQLIDQVLELDKKQRELLGKIEELRQERNKLTKTDIEKGRGIKQQLKNLEPELRQIEEKLQKRLYDIPNLPADDVPVGKDESENVVVRKWGEPRKFNFDPLDHVKLGERLDIIDIEASAKISGSRFCYLKNEAVFIQFALVQLVLQTLTNEKIITKVAKSVDNPFSTPFSPIVPPVLIKPEVMKKMDRLDPIQEKYYLPEDPLVLVGSAEHTLGPILMDKTVNYTDLPIRYIGYSTAFRREAGSYGKDVKGIFRVHQFDKLEMESFIVQEYGDKEQQFFVAIQEYLMQQLEIPYQVVMICTGDMGKPNYRQIDLECWMPGQNRYRETHTSDYMADYQARRLNACYKNEDGKRKFIYMNDATAIAIGRTLIAILENYQEKDGSVVIPKVLQKYVGKKKIESKNA